MHRMAALASITLTLTFGFANHAFAQSWQICNKTSESDKPFTIRRHQNCEGRNFRTVQSKQVSIDLNKNYTTNLTGSLRPGTSNFD
jgi:hypothetical protein